MYQFFAKSKKQPGIIWRYYLFSFLASISFYTAVLVPFYTDWGGISLAQVQFLQAWMMFWAVLLEVPTGIIADRFGRKYSAALGCLFAFLSCVLYGTIPSFGSFLVAEFLTALAIALISGAGEALLFDSLKEEKKEESFKTIAARSASIGSAAALLSAPLGGVLAAYYGLNAPMLINSIPMLLAAFLLLSAKEPVSAFHNTTDRHYLKIGISGLAYLFKHPYLKRITLNAMLVYLPAYFLVWLYQPLLQQLLFPIIYFGIVRAVFSLSSLMSTWNLTYTEKLFGSTNRFLFISGILSIIPIFLLALFPSVPMIFVAIILVSAFSVARFSRLNAINHHYIPSDRRATILSGISMLQRILFVVLNPVVGFMADISISLSLLFIGLIALLGLIILKLPHDLEG